MTIDGINISYYGMTLLDKSYNSLLKYPTRKSVKFSNYAEKDGIIPDLRKIEFEPRQISLNFAVKHDDYNNFKTKYENFISHITETGHRIIDFGDGLVYKLRYDKTNSYNAPFIIENRNGFATLTVNFIEDEFVIPNIQNPVGGINLRGHYLIDGKDFGDFGIYPDGKTGEVLKYPDTKQTFSDGLNIDTETIKLKQKDITIPLWMIAKTKTEFLNNYYAFFNAFNKKGKQMMYIKEIDAITYAYYLDCSNFTVSWDDFVFAKLQIRVMIPVITWLGRTDEIWLLLLDPATNKLLGDENGKALTLKIN